MARRCLDFYCDVCRVNAASLPSITIERYAKGMAVGTRDFVCAVLPGRALLRLGRIGCIV